jgi:hypothetical protein
MALLKDTRVRESMRLEFRAEFFNVLNHTQFNAVDGDFSGGPAFGTLLSTQPSRIGQLSLKLSF